MTERDAKIIKDAEEQGIPIFVFTAKDELTVEALGEYRNIAYASDCSNDFIEGVNARITEFDNCQKANLRKLKLPD